MPMVQRIHVHPDGPTHARVAVLHSNGMCGASYRPLAELLAAQGVQSALFDLPGFAGAPPPDPLGWDGLLGAVAPAVDAELGDDGVLVGHSLGGLVAVLLAPRLRLRALVLLEPAIIPWRWLARVGAALYVRKVFTDDPVAFTNRGPWFWRLHDPERYPVALMELALASHARTDRDAVAALHTGLPALYPLDFDAVRVPTVVVRGASSGAVMRWGQRDLLARLPKGRGVVVPDAGHWLVGEQDAALATSILQACATAAPRPLAPLPRDPPPKPLSPGARDASGAGATPRDPRRRP